MSLGWCYAEKYLNNLFHAALLVASAYIAANPEYAWVAVAIQGMGQGISPPK